MTMGLPSVYIEGFVKGEKDDFYALYTGNQISIKHYYYDENAKTGSGKKLSIYSLEENDTVRQAVSIFQQKYPDVEVTYKTGDSDSSTTKSDKIRVLNTELINRSGADVLILDDLPVDSFIVKGCAEGYFRYSKSADRRRNSQKEPGRVFSADRWQDI